MTRLKQIEEQVSARKRQQKVFNAYSRGRLSWDEAERQMMAEGVAEADISKALLNQDGRFG